MSNKSVVNKYVEWITIMSAVFSVVIGVLALLSQLGYIGSGPDVSYVQNPIVIVGDKSAQGILLVNRGSRGAEDVLIRVTYSKNTKIQDLFFEDNAFQKKPVIEEGGVGKNMFLANIQILPPDSKGFIYLQVNSKEKPEIVSVTYGDRIANEELFVYERSLTDKILLSGGFFAFIFLLLKIMSDRPQKLGSAIINPHKRRARKKP